MTTAQYWLLLATICAIPGFTARGSVVFSLMFCAFSVAALIVESI